MKEIQDKIVAFNAFLETRMPEQEEAIIQRMDHLQVLLAQSGNLLSHAKSLQEAENIQATKAVLCDPELAGMGLSILKDYIKSRLKDYNYLVNQLDRINSTAGKQLMALQTILSYRKEQMKL